jgi:aminoglycoside phosphotransferase (APT) family kinase protein
MEARLRAWVEDAVGGSVATARRRHTGGSRAMWFVDIERGTDTLEAVVRVESGALDGTHLSLGREVAVYRALEPTSVPVPRLLGVSPDGRAALLERLRGRSDLSGLSPPEASALLDSFISALAALHALEPSELGIPGMEMPSSSEAHALGEVTRWTDLARKHLGSIDPMLACALAWLQNHPPRSVARTVLVQGDTGPGNFVFDGSEVTGLVDWELAHAGDPMDDIAWLDLRASSAPWAFGDVVERDRRYERATGVPVDAGAVRYYSVLVHLRCAVITGIALARGGGALGLAPYVAPHHRFLVGLGRALAAALDVRSEVGPSLRLDALAADDEEGAAVHERAIDALRDHVLPELTSGSARLHAREALLVLEHARARVRLGPQLERDEAEDRIAVLGRHVDDAELGNVVAQAGRSVDPEVLGLLCRRAERRLACWATPSAGGWGVPDEPAVPR